MPEESYKLQFSDVIFVGMHWKPTSLNAGRHCMQAPLEKSIFMQAF